MLRLVIVYSLSILALIGHCQTTADDPIVIEGTIISPVRSYSIKADSNDYHSSIYSSRLVEVNRVFNGSIDEEIIEVFFRGGRVGMIGSSLSHGQQSLPHEGTSAIFRLVDHSIRKGGDTLAKLSHYSIYFFSSLETVFRQGHSSDIYSRNVEEEIYQVLEEEFNRPRKNIRPPATRDPIAITHCTENLLTVPNRQTGLVFSVSSHNHLESSGLAGFEVMMSSSNSPVYLKEAELIIEYNTKAFGDSIVMKGNLISLTIPNHFNLADYFDIRVKDITPNRIQINWTSKSTVSEQMQLLPQPYRAALIVLHPIDRNERTGIKLIAEANCNMHFDRERNSEYTFDYVATEKGGYKTSPKVIELMPFIINEVTSKKVLKPGDEVLIKGENFSERTRVYLHAQTTSGHYRYKQVPSKMILSKSDSAIRIVVPKMLLPDDDLSGHQEWYTVSGKVMLKKGHGSSQISATSADKIEVKNDVGLPDIWKMVEKMKPKSE